MSGRTEESLDIDCASFCPAEAPNLCCVLEPSCYGSPAEP